MKGSAHRRFALAGSVLLNSLIYHAPKIEGPPPLNLVLSSAGKPFGYAEVLHFLAKPEPPDVHVIACKLTFFTVVVLAANLPDRLERMSRDHRGFTHSLVFLFFLLSGLVFFYRILGEWLHLDPFLQHIVGATFLGIFSAVVCHIAADMCTHRGVKILWPSQQHLGWVPKALRPRNESRMAAAILWLFVAGVGYLIGIGFAGF